MSRRITSSEAKKRIAKDNRLQRRQSLIRTLGDADCGRLCTLAQMKAMGEELRLLDEEFGESGIFRAVRDRRPYLGGPSE